MSSSSSSSRSEESKTITLSDKDLRAWFKFDRQALRWARRKYGPELGPRLWHDNFRPIDDDTVAAIASDVYENMRRQGVRELAPPEGPSGGPPGLMHLRIALVGTVVGRGRAQHQISVRDLHCNVTDLRSAPLSPPPLSLCSSFIVPCTRL